MGYVSTAYRPPKVDKEPASVKQTTMSNLHPKIKELKQRSAPITYSEVMSVSSEGLTVEDNKIKGYLIAWGVRDTYGTKFIKGCCAKSLNERGPGTQSKYKITLLWQ